MRALQFATATVNLASQNAFLFWATQTRNLNLNPTLKKKDSESGGFYLEFSFSLHSFSLGLWFCSEYSVVPTTGSRRLGLSEPEVRLRGCPEPETPGPPPPGAAGAGPGPGAGASRRRRLPGGLPVAPRGVLGPSLSEGPRAPPATPH